MYVVIHTVLGREFVTKLELIYEYNEVKCKTQFEKLLPFAHRKENVKLNHDYLVK